MELFLFLVGVSLYTFVLFPLTEWKRSLPILYSIQILVILIGIYVHAFYVPCFFMILLWDIYVLFYTKSYEYFTSYCIKQGVLFLIAGSCLWLDITNPNAIFLVTFFTGTYLLMLYVMKRMLHYLCIGIILCFLISLYLCVMGNRWVGISVFLGMSCMVELSYRQFASRFYDDTTAFQTQVMSHHYEEVKSVYLDMRGWRHDYHNHLQSIKAYLEMGQLDGMRNYLNQLEHDLVQVDHLLKTGNLMVDAILNSKLTIAKQRHIQIQCKAIAPETMSIRDTDLCVILGNLMDNAMEACGKVTEEERFIRIYIDIVRKQFYISITNAAPQVLSFEEQNYISNKRGNHGHGMKRVQLSVDKYDGYLNLKNEAGVFVSELMIPLLPIDEQKPPFHE